MTELGIITTRAEVLPALDALPPPAAGDIRVFRGQSRDFGAMTPVALPTAGSADNICSVYPATLVGAISGEHVDDLDVFQLWACTIRQHNGDARSSCTSPICPRLPCCSRCIGSEWKIADAAYDPPGPYDPATAGVVNIGWSACCPPKVNLRVFMCST
jgi:hypothetical protein